METVVNVASRETECAGCVLPYGLPVNDAELGVDAGHYHFVASVNGVMKVGGRTETREVFATRQGARLAVEMQRSLSYAYGLGRGYVAIIGYHPAHCYIC